MKSNMDRVAKVDPAAPKLNPFEGTCASENGEVGENLNGQ
jgi:hypothetical protein